TYAQTHAWTTEEELTHALGDRFAAAEIQETLKELVRLHVFVTEQPQMKPIQPIVDVERFPLGALVLNVANKCNLHCSYCYEPEVAKYSSSPVQMDWDTARQSVDFLFRKAGGNREVSICFFGGEALLNFKLLRAVVAYAEEKGQREERKVDFSLTTNAT